MPFFQSQPAPQPTYTVQPARQVRQPQRTARNDRYLPTMPEMLQPTNQAPAEFARNPQALSQPTAALAIGQGTKVVRGQAPEDGQTKPIAKLLPPTELTMPSPEEMGIAKSAAKPATPADWSSVRSRLDQLGASYSLGKSSDGTFHFTCALPKAGTPAQEQQFVSHGRSQEEVIASAMLQVEEWNATRN